MSKSKKNLERFLSVPADYSWDEFVSLLQQLGFEDISKKGGSFRTFKDSAGRKLFFHKPHPGNIVKKYVLRETKSKLLEFGLLKPEDCV